MLTLSKTKKVSSVKPLDQAVDLSGPYAEGMIAHRLRARMEAPQRHRLLHGYPMKPLLEVHRGDPFAGLELDDERALLVGVLPHTFCNPTVPACGFCTFPHEKLQRSLLGDVTAEVAHEIRSVIEAVPSLARRRVVGIYFGGGTANLTPPAALRAQLDALTGLRIEEAELTLEGVPSYFLLHDEALLDVVAAAPVRHRRLSMGVQTFDPAWLARMGREGFGDRRVVEQVVEAAHRRGFTASADLLFNLPGAPKELALRDVETAAATGLDQICVYNLVLIPRLNTPWARDAELLAARPSPDVACEAWIAVRARLLELGFVQTTLTNFERREIAESPRRFVYELAVFEPGTTDMIGFGPGGLSTFTERSGRTARKWMSPELANGYLARERDRGLHHRFDYDRRDLEVLHLTRDIARGALDLERFFARFPDADRRRVELFVATFEAAGLVCPKGQSWALTPRGMSYADAIAGVIAELRLVELGLGPDANDAKLLRMG